MKTYSSKNFGITQDLFMKWRSPRFGVSNPTNMNNNVWEWLIYAELEPYGAYQELKLVDTYSGKPTWSFSRFGQSETLLKDGRTVYVGGEHEDFYDPDFNIYNDVIVKNTDGSLEIYGYPESIFPPTDFHSATLVDDGIIIIGCLGYKNRRVVGQTNVYKLYLEDFRFEEISTKGSCPGWIYRHEAVLSSDGGTLIISRGELYQKNDQYVDNHNYWQLDLNTGIWEKLSDIHWPMWSVSRADGDLIKIFELRMAIWELEFNRVRSPQAWALKNDVNRELKIETLKNLYAPNIAHETLIKEDESNVYRIKIDGVGVRYVEEEYRIKVVVEGELLEETIELLKEDLRVKLSILEYSEFFIE